MLSLDSIVHQNSGGVGSQAASSTITVSLAGADQTEAGSTLYVVFGLSSMASGAPPSGWVRVNDNSASAGEVPSYRRGPNEGLVAGETSWVFNTGAGTSGPAVWVVLEVTNIDADYPTDSPGGFPIAAASVISGTTGIQQVLSSVYSGLIISAHLGYHTTVPTPDTWSGHTDGFTELVELGANDGTKSVGLSVSYLPVNLLGTYGPTATCSRTLSSTNPGNVTTVILAEAGTRRAADVVTCAGFEIGSAGFTVNELESYAFAATGHQVVAAAARTGSYGLRLAGASAIRNTQIFISVGSVQAKATRVSFRLNTVPGTDLLLVSDTNFAIRFIAASGKLGAKVGAGSEVLSDLALTEDVWVSVDYRLDMSGTTWKLDWQVTYADGQTPVVQTQATLGGQVATPIASTTILGWTAASVGDVDFDDYVQTSTVAHHPLGDMRIYPLKVDPAGTLTISGTAGNFQTFTANGTMAAWNATTARGAIDDIPPTIGASADGIAQITVAASDYVEIPLETVDLGAIPGYIRGVRLCFCGWAASATASFIGFRAYDGTTEYNLSGAAIDRNFDNAAQTWVCWMVRPSSGRLDWTKTKLDALTARVGFSTDATPDLGIHAVLAEAVVRKAEAEEMFGTAGDPVHIQAKRDPDTLGLLGMEITTVGAGATVNYEIVGVPQTPVVVAADVTHYESTGAGADFHEVNRIDVTPDTPA